MSGELYVELSIHDKDKILCGLVDFPWCLKFEVGSHQYAFYKNSLYKGVAEFYIDGHLKDQATAFQSILEDYITVGAKDLNSSSYELALIHSGFHLRNPRGYFFESGGASNETLDQIALIEVSQTETCVFKDLQDKIILESDYNTALKVAHYLEWVGKPFRVASSPL